jgi:DNA polymerase III subunit delta'
MRGERPHHGWLFSGAEGLGKATLALKLARRLLAEATDPNLPVAGLEIREDHPTASLMDAWSHPDFILIDRLPKDAKMAEKPRADWAENEELRRSIRVDQVRDLHRRFATRPTFSSRRVVVIDGAETCEVSASNALLKMLEEPPTGTIFILVTHAPGRLLPTIRSRCRVLRFAGLEEDAMRLALRSALSSVGEQELQALITLGQGSPGRAIRLAGLGVDAMTVMLNKIATTGDPDNGLRVALSASMSPKAAQARFEAFLGLVPGFLAQRARSQQGVVLSRTIKQWEEARDLASHAIPGSLDPQSVTFALASHVAALAPAGGAAKA